MNGIIVKQGAENSLVTCFHYVCRGERWVERSVLQRAFDIKMKAGGETKGPLAALTPRERAIAHLIGQGLRNKEVAEEPALLAVPPDEDNSLGPSLFRRVSNRSLR